MKMEKENKEAAAAVGSWEWLKTFLYKREENKEGVRNALLVVATLIAAVTFQAGVNPPGGDWQDNTTPGQAVYSAQELCFYFFLIANSMALSSSIMIIIFLTYGFPLQFEVWFSSIAMFVTYASSIFAVTPECVSFRFILIMAVGPFLGRFLWEVFLGRSGK